MQRDIYWLCACQLRPDNFDKFKAVVRQLVELTRKEAGCLAYEFTVSADRSVVHIFEHYRDSEAAVDHITKTFQQFAERFTALVSVSSFVVYGEPSAEAKAILDGFGALYLARFDGITN